MLERERERERNRVSGGDTLKNKKLKKLSLL